MTKKSLFPHVHHCNQWHILYKKKVLKEKDVEEIVNDVKSKVQECVDFAENSPFPKPEDLFKGIYHGDYNFLKE